MIYRKLEDTDIADNGIKQHSITAVYFLIIMTRFRQISDTGNT